ncbi:30S ribosomal protein S20 [Candidatus Desantisbacteria bacterium]|nr:30S ribosomal protein S20 [Candidatus Desantisbacteria bacterium]
MQVHKSAIKRARQNKKRCLRNAATKSRMKTLIKKVHTAMAAKEGVEITLSEAISAIDKAANKGIIHKNTANRKKSRLCQGVHVTK